MKLKALICLVLVLQAACSPKHDAEPEKNWDKLSEEALDYETASRLIFKTRCYDCHNAARPLGNLNLLSYEELFRPPAVVVSGDPDSSRLIVSIRSGEMPPTGRKPVSQEELLFLEAWILNGAPKRASKPIKDRPQPPWPQEPEVITFDYLFLRIFQPKCSRCHSPPDAEDFVDVTSLEELKNNFLYPDLLIKGDPESSRLYQSVLQGRMPSKGEPLSETELDLLRRWILDGREL